MNPRTSRGSVVFRKSASSMWSCSTPGYVTLFRPSRNENIAFPGVCVKKGWRVASLYPSKTWRSPDSLDRPMNKCMSYQLTRLDGNSRRGNYYQHLEKDGQVRWSSGWRRCDGCKQEYLSAAGEVFPVKPRLRIDEGVPVTISIEQQ